MPGTYGYVQVFEESKSARTATNSVELGTRRLEDGNEYLYVYNKSTSTAANGSCVYLSASTGFSVTISGVSNQGPLGVVQDADIAITAYGWVMTQGHGDVLSAGESTIQVGDPLIPTDGATGGASTPTNGTGTTDRYRVFGQWTEASSGTCADALAAYVNATGY